MLDTFYFGVGNTSNGLGNGSNLGDFLMEQDGDFHADGDVIAASTSVGSDIRLKENVNNIPYGLNEILQMRVVEFDWKRKRNKSHDIGFIAQEMEKIVPEVVKKNLIDLGSKDADKKYKTIDYGKIVAVLVEAVKELTERVEELEGDK